MKKSETDILFKKSYSNFYKIFIEKKQEGTFEYDNVICILSPGRVNIIGEHTDYNNGYSISVAINKYITLTGKENNSDSIEIYSENFNEYCNFLLGDFGLKKEMHWSNYIKGVLKEYIERDYNIGGFNLVIDGNLPMGIGISSSAALEVGIANFLNELFYLNTSREEVIDICNRAENKFVGVNCGLLDQITIAKGKEGNAIFLNFKDLSNTYIPLNLKDSIFLIIDTKEKRNLSNTEYNKRRSECEEAVRLINAISKEKKIDSLSEIDMDLLYKLKEKLPIALFKRAKHVVSENNRVLLAKELLGKSDIEKLGLILLDSHNSLKHDFEVSTKRIDFLVDEIIKINGVYGARLMGAGFGGSIISIVNKNKMDDIIDTINKRFSNKFKEALDILECISSDGTKRVKC